MTPEKGIRRNACNNAIAAHSYISMAVSRSEFNFKSSYREN